MFSNGFPGAEPNSSLKWRFKRFIFFFFFLSNLVGFSFSVITWSTSMWRKWITESKEGKRVQKLRNSSFRAISDHHQLVDFVRLVPCWWKNKDWNTFLRLVKCMAFCESSGINLSFRFGCIVLFSVVLIVINAFLSHRSMLPRAHILCMKMIFP